MLGGTRGYNSALMSGFQLPSMHGGLAGSDCPLSSCSDRVTDLLPCRCETAEARLQAAQVQLEEVLAKSSQQELQAAQAEIDSLRLKLVAVRQEAESFRWAHHMPLLALCRQQSALAGQLYQPPPATRAC